MCRLRRAHGACPPRVCVWRMCVCGLSVSVSVPVSVSLSVSLSVSVSVSLSLSLSLARARLGQTVLIQTFSHVSLRAGTRSIYLNGYGSTHDRTSPIILDQRLPLHLHDHQPRNRHPRCPSKCRLVEYDRQWIPCVRSSAKARASTHTTGSPFTCRGSRSGTTREARSGPPRSIRMISLGHPN